MNFDFVYHQNTYSTYFLEKGTMKMSDEEKLIEQERLMYESFNEEQKRNYFVGLFVGEVVSSLIEKRKKYHLTQKQIAQAMNVKQSYISRIENLKKVPTLETIGKYLFAINHSVEEQLYFLKMMIDIENGTSPLSKMLKQKNNVYRQAIAK